MFGVATAVVFVLGLCVSPCSVTTIATDRLYLTEVIAKHIIEDLMATGGENAESVYNHTMDAFIKNFTKTVFNKFTGIFIENTTKIDFDNNTKFTFYNSTGLGVLIGLNVCTRIKSYKIKKEVTDEKHILDRPSYLCFKNWRLRCRSEENDSSEKKEITENNIEILSECCKGYVKMPNRTECQPFCTENCNWGTCISPNICKCDAYYYGPTCREHKGCSPGKFGFDCIQSCKCQNNAICNYFNGSCFCQPGYWGKYCENKCISGFYGDKCRNLCKCQTGAQCDPVNGACYCLPGYTGSHCEIQCPPGLYGYKCQNECKYQNGTKCDLINGECSCLPEYEKRDAKVNECHCENGTLCNSVNETCSCEPGYVGKKCKLTCPPGYYGKNCSDLCKCNNNEKCDAVNGDCYCNPGYTGEYCSLVCPSGFYGYQCQYQCKCEIGAQCDPVNGACTTEDSGIRNESEKLCPSGVNCDSNCTYCQNGAKCRVTDGTCICEPGFSGPTCSEESSDIFNALQLESTKNEAVWIFDILVILSFLVMSIICVVIMLCYFYYCHKCELRHVNNFELRKPSNIESNPNIQVICNSLNCSMNRGSVMHDLIKPRTSYTNDIFYDNYTIGHRFDDDTGENLYFEIDESTVKRAEDLYDHLDFLRPTASWKPHYQSAMVQNKELGTQEQGVNNLKKEDA